MLSLDVRTAFTIMHCAGTEPDAQDRLLEPTPDLSISDRRHTVAFDENSRLREIIADERAKAILDKHFPGASTHPQLSMGLGLTLKQISYYPESGMTADKLKALVEELGRLDT
jgi:hypothetical protein